MSKFIITATDRATGQRLYGRVDQSGRRVGFRTGYALASTPQARLGLHTEPGCATLLDIEQAGALLIGVIMGLGQASWIENPCIMLHHA